jgi:hypothetical protein
MVEHWCTVHNCWRWSKISSAIHLQLGWKNTAHTWFPSTIIVSCNNDLYPLWTDCRADTAIVPWLLLGPRVNNCRLLRLVRLVPHALLFIIRYSKSYAAMMEEFIFSRFPDGDALFVQCVYPFRCLTTLRSRSATILRLWIVNTVRTHDVSVLNCIRWKKLLHTEWSRFTMIQFALGFVNTHWNARLILFRDFEQPHHDEPARNVPKDNHKTSLDRVKYVNIYILPMGWQGWSCSGCKRSSCIWWGEIQNAQLFQSHTTVSISHKKQGFNQRHIVHKRVHFEQSRSSLSSKDSTFHTPSLKNPQKQTQHSFVFTATASTNDDDSPSAV